MGRRRSVPAVQATRGRPVFYPDVHRRGSVHGPAIGPERPEVDRPAGNGVAAMEMLADRNLQAGATASTGLSGDLEHLLPQGHGVIPRHDTRFFMAEDQVEIHRAERHKRARRVARGPRESGVVARQEDLGEVGIRRLERGGD